MPTLVQTAKRRNTNRNITGSGERSEERQEKQEGREGGGDPDENEIKLRKRSNNMNRNDNDGDGTGSNRNNNRNTHHSHSDNHSSSTEKVKSMRKEFYKNHENQNKDAHENDHDHGNDDPPNHNPWDNLWEKELTPWDIGSTTPVLQSELKRIRERDRDRLHDLNSPTTTCMNVPFSVSSLSPSLRSFIPGCGGGYDLMTVAKHHQDLLLSLSSSKAATTATSSSSSSTSAVSKLPFVPESTVIGLDISPTSLKQAANNIQSLMLLEEENMKTKRQRNTRECSSCSSTSSISGNHVPTFTTDINLMCGDFFTSESEWSNVYNTKYSSDSIATSNNIIESMGNQENTGDDVTKFDFIFDYTFFCALPVNLRQKWGTRMSELLRPESGRLLTLMFPIPKDTSALIPPLEGPPFPVTVKDYRSVLEPLGFQMMEGSPYEHNDTIQPRKGVEFVCWWQLVNTEKRISML